MGAAAMGMTGLETALSVVQDAMVETGLLDWAGVADRMSRRAGARSAGSPARARRSRSGAPANLVLVDPAARWTVDPASMATPAGTPRSGARPARPGRRDVPARAPHRPGRRPGRARAELEDGAGVRQAARGRDCCPARLLVVGLAMLAGWRRRAAPAARRPRPAAVAAHARGARSPR